MVLVASAGKSLNRTFLHAAYRLHTVCRWNFIGETYLVEAGLIGLGREKAVASIGLGWASY
jgi:hypothetical protein